MSATRKPYKNSTGFVGGTDITHEATAPAHLRWQRGVPSTSIDAYGGMNETQAHCNCTVGAAPCRLYPIGNARHRTGRCEGCAMGLHRGHADASA